MQIPLDIAFRNCPPDEALRREVVRQAGHLERFSDRITGCSVVVEAPHTRHRRGGTYKVTVRLTMPQHKDVIVNQSHGDVPENEHGLVAIANAFAAARRRLQDAMREMQGQTKAHLPPAHGHIVRFLAGTDGGFIETADGGELYFHRNAVLDDAFDRLEVGSEVRFVEETGDKGPQATSVRLVGKHHPV